MAMPTSMNITWVTKGFLDYRIPVFQELDALCGNRLHVITGDRLTPPRVQEKLQAVLGPRAHVLQGEKILGTDRSSEKVANRSVRLPYQPGLLQEIRETRPEILVGDGFFQWTFYALLHRMQRGTPLVVCYERTAHTERNAQWYRRFYRRLALRWVDVVCCSGKLCAEYTRTLGVAPERITTGHMAADTENLQILSKKVTPAQCTAMRSRWNGNGLVFLYVGRLTSQKGIEQLLQGWALFEKNSPGAGTLVLVGDGAEAAAMREKAGRLGLRDVRFPGWVDYDGIAVCYAAADVLVMPTLEDNWSLVVPEAMACGLPVLTSLYNGCWADLVRDGENGWVFDSLRPDDICRCLALCEREKDNLPAFGRKSLEIVSSHTPRRAAREILKACAIASGKGDRCRRALGGIPVHHR